MLLAAVGVGLATSRRHRSRLIRVASAPRSVYACHARGVDGPPGGLGAAAEDARPPHGEPAPTPPHDGASESAGAGRGRGRRRGARVCGCRRRRRRRCELWLEDAYTRLLERCAPVRSAVADSASASSRSSGRAKVRARRAPPPPPPRRQTAPPPRHRLLHGGATERARGVGRAVAERLRDEERCDIHWSRQPPRLGGRTASSGRDGGARGGVRLARRDARRRRRRDGTGRTRARGGWLASWAHTWTSAFSSRQTGQSSRPDFWCSLSPFFLFVCSFAAAHAAGLSGAAGAAGGWPSSAEGLRSDDAWRASTSAAWRRASRRQSRC